MLKISEEIARYQFNSLYFKNSSSNFIFMFMSLLSISYPMNVYVCLYFNHSLTLQAETYKDYYISEFSKSYVKKKKLLW